MVEKRGTNENQETDRETEENGKKRGRGRRDNEKKEREKWQREKYSLMGKGKEIKTLLKKISWRTRNIWKRKRSRRDRD